VENRRHDVTRQWRSDQGFLIERPAAVAVVGALLAASQRAWGQPPMDYWLVDEVGTLRKRFAVVVGSLEDELSATLFAVENQALVRLQVRELYGRQSSVDRVVEINGLVEVPAGDKAGLARIQVAVGDEKARHEAMDRRGEARLDAIPGAQKKYDAGDAFRTAQRILEWRVTQYDDSLSAAMLRGLLRFGDLYATAPAVKPALDLFVIACRQAAFDRTLAQGDVMVPGAVGVVWMRVPEREQAAKLAAVLRNLERELNVDADIQEQVDARLNAIALWAAARSVAGARTVLATMLERGP
jgi:hypothetical protein